MCCVSVGDQDRGMGLVCNHTTSKPVDVHVINEYVALSNASVNDSGDRSRSFEI